MYGRFQYRNRGSAGGDVSVRRAPLPRCNSHRVRSTYSPKLLELERTIEPLLPTEGEPLKSDAIPAAAGDVSIGDDGSSMASTASKMSRQAPSDVDDTSNSTQVGKSESQASDTKVAPQTELKNLLVAYFYISDLASRLNMPNLTGVTKHALSLCAST